MEAGRYDDGHPMQALVTNLDAPPTLLRNDSPQGSWLIVAPEAPAGAGPLVGTEVRVLAGGLRLLGAVASSGSFLSAHDTRLHFGLGGASKAERVEVRWSDGTLSVTENVPAGRVLKVIRGASTPAL